MPRMRVHRPDEASFAGMPTFMKMPLVIDPEDLEGSDVAILGAPMDDMVTYRPGARFGPRAIRAAHDDSRPSAWHMDLGIDPFADLGIVDAGDAPVTPGDAHRSHRAVRAAVSSIVEAGAVPVVLGGDHSIAYPDITAVTAGPASGELAVVHLDAHADTATENYGVEWSHGTPFRHLVDEGIVPGPRVVQIGLRGYWPEPPEFTWARQKGVRWHRMQDIADRGIDAVVDSVLDEIVDAESLFLSVDIDVLDPAFAPGTGTPEPGGMTTRELLRVVRRVVLAHDLAGMEVVEVSPPYDHAETTAMAANRAALEAISALALRRRDGGTVRWEPSAERTTR
jgi:agmatinase